MRMHAPRLAAAALLAATALTGCGGATPASTPVPTGVVSGAEGSVVPVRCTNVAVNLDSETANSAIGTGFVTPLGIVTAAHVVSSCASAGPGSVSAGPYVVSVSDNDPGNDLALIRLNGAGRPLAFRTSLPAVGSAVELLGSPGSAVDPFAGTVVATHSSVTLHSEQGAQETLADTIVVSANGVHAGDSGGPAIDASGRVVGIVEGGADGQVYLTPAADTSALSG